MYVTLIPLLLAVSAAVGQSTNAPQVVPEYTFKANINLTTHGEGVISSNMPNVTSLSVYEVKCVQKESDNNYLCNLKELSRNISGHVPALPNVGQNDNKAPVPFEVSYGPDGVPSIKVDRNIGCRQLSVVRKVVALATPGVSNVNLVNNQPVTFVAKEKSVLGDCYTSFTVARKQDNAGSGGQDAVVELQKTRDVQTCSHTNQYFSALRHLYAGATIQSSKASMEIVQSRALKSSTSTVGKVRLFGGLVPVTVRENTDLVLTNVGSVSGTVQQIPNPKIVDIYFDGKLFECRN